MLTIKNNKCGTVFFGTTGMRPVEAKRLEIVCVPRREHKCIGRGLVVPAYKVEKNDQPASLMRSTCSTPVNGSRLDGTCVSQRESHRGDQLLARCRRGLGNPGQLQEIGESRYRQTRGVKGQVHPEFAGRWEICILSRL